MRAEAVCRRLDPIEADWLNEKLFWRQDVCWWPEPGDTVLTYPLSVRFDDYIEDRLWEARDWCAANLPADAWGRDERHVFVRGDEHAAKFMLMFG